MKCKRETKNWLEKMLGKSAENIENDRGGKKESKNVKKDNSGWIYLYPGLNYIL